MRQTAFIREVDFYDRFHVDVIAETELTQDVYDPFLPCKAGERLSVNHRRVIQKQEEDCEILGTAPNDYDYLWDYGNFSVSYFCEIFGCTFSSDCFLPAAVDGVSHVPHGVGSKKKAQGVAWNKQKGIGALWVQRDFPGASFFYLV